MKWNAYLMPAAVILALIAAVADATMAPIAYLALGIIGVGMAMMNITEKENMKYMISVIGVAAASTFFYMMIPTAVGDATFIKTFFTNMLVAFGTAAVVIGLKGIWEVAKG